MKHPRLPKKYLFNRYCPNCQRKMQVISNPYSGDMAYVCDECDHSQAVSVFDELDEADIYGTEKDT